MIEYHPSDLSEGKFYVLRGVLVFLEKSEDYRYDTVLQQLVMLQTDAEQ